MSTGMTRVVAGTLCSVLLLTSCATRQHSPNSLREVRLGPADLSVSERAHGFAPESSQSPEVSGGQETAEPTGETPSELDAKPRTESPDAEEKAPEEPTTAGKVVVGVLKFLGAVLLIALVVAAGAGAALAPLGSLGK